MGKFFSSNSKTGIVILLSLIILLSSCSNFDCETCVLKADTKFHYSATFKDKDTVINYDIEKLVTKGWFLLQNKLVYRIRPQTNESGNKKTIRQYTGFVQNKDRLWLHPPRSEEFRYLTQLAPYPEVKYPIAVGDTISGSIHMMGSWGEWNGKRSNFHLVVNGNDSFTTALGMLNCWVFQGVGYLEQDTSWSTFYFNENMGFVKLEYKNNKNEQFVMELNSIEENSQ